MKLEDTLDLGSSASACRFDSCPGHHMSLRIISYAELNPLKNDIILYLVHAALKHYEPLQKSYMAGIQNCQMVH